MVSVLAPIPYATLQSSFDTGTPQGGRYYWKAHYLTAVSDGLVNALVDSLNNESD